MSVPTNPYLDFGGFALTVLARVGVAMVIGILLGRGLLAGYQRVGAKRLTVPTRGTQGMVSLLGAVGGYIAGTAVLDPVRGIAVGAMVAAGSLLVATAWGRMPTPSEVHTALQRDELFEVKATVSIIFVVYTTLRWRAVQRDLLVGLSESDQSLAATAASWIAGLAVFSLILVLVVGLIGITLIQIAWRWVVPRMEETIVELDPKHQAIVEDLEQPTVAYGKLLGSGILVVGFVWLLLRESTGAIDLIEVVIFGMAVVTLYMIVSAIGDVRFVRDSALSRPIVRAMLKREGAQLITYLGTTFIGLVVLVYAIDLTVHVYYTQVMIHGPDMLSSDIATILSQGEWSPTRVVRYYAFYAGGSISSLGLRLITLLFPITVAVVLLPYVVKYLYFEGFRRVLMVVATYMLFLAIAILVNLLLSGEITHLSEIGLASLLPTVGAGISTRAASWLITESEYIICDSCHERVLRSGNYCLNCGSELE